MILDDIKIALRISHTALDDEITDTIKAARHDLKLTGILAIKADDETDNVDPLIKRAIKIYCKAEFAIDSIMAERYKQSYIMLKTHLALSSEYTVGDQIV